jgi:ABC-type transport system involved in multi-copper enzyme maturation permease subunit
MNAPAVIYALRWLIADTFRQTMTSRVFWIMLAISGLCTVFCLGVSIEGGAVRDGKELWAPDGSIMDAPRETGRMSLLFGAFEVSFSREPKEQVHFLLSIFASWIAGAIGILATLVWTAGFVPEALDPSAASVMLAKPVPRWLILTGKYLGVVAFVATQATVFFVGTWAALGIRTDEWEVGYLAGIPLMTFHFAVFFSMSVLIAVFFRSTTACIVGTVLFWFLCYSVNYARDFVLVYSDICPSGEPVSAVSSFLSELGYWLLPKPADYTIMLEETLVLGNVKTTLGSQQPFESVLRNGLFHPLASLATSALFAVFMLWQASSRLAKIDY